MTSKQIEIIFTEIEGSDVTANDLKLINQAKQAAENAYAPYSNFRVGCAVLLVNEKVVVGNNQENAAYPSGLCAERVALFSAKSASKTEIDTIVVVAIGEDGLPADAFSCGNCRQVMLEYSSQQSNPVRILMQTRRETYIEVSDVKELLPFHFNSDSLQ